MDPSEALEFAKFSHGGLKMQPVLFCCRAGAKVKEGLGVVNCEQNLGGFEEKIITLLDGSVSQFVLQRSILSGPFHGWP